MRTSKPSILAALFAAALCTASGAAIASPTIGGTYAAVTPQNVELLTLRPTKSEIRGSYRVLHLNAAQIGGLDDQRTALSAVFVPAPNQHAFALEDTRTMTLRFDPTYQRAIAITPEAQTQSFARVNAEQLGLLVEMARYGGLFEVCKAHRDVSCAGLNGRLGELVPFRPFPVASATAPLLSYTMTAVLDHRLALAP